MDKHERQRRLEELVREILELTGDDPLREGLLETPSRVARMLLDEMCSGSNVTEEQLIQEVKVFRDESVAGQFVAVRDVSFSSTCEHHGLPFFGTAAVVYIPNGKGMISGLSKVARVLDKIAARNQVQERITAQLFGVLQKAVEPSALLVFVDASHQCMTCRGVKKTESRTSTLKFGGLFESDHSLRHDALSLLRRAA